MKLSIYVSLLQFFVFKYAMGKGEIEVELWPRTRPVREVVVSPSK